MFFDDGKCFACGPHNPIGLKLVFQLDGEGRAVTTFVAPEEFQGFSKVLHGGIICTLLDEAMAWAMILHGYLGATASMRVKFRKPVPIGERVTITGEILKQGIKSWTLSSRILNEQGQVLAEAEGIFAAISKIPHEELNSKMVENPPYSS
ncbi:MAG: PaaI family thioesterase [Firmicutes bacterium]|nr:PaaI family thioesterase [Bacillota bacterium]HXL04905.1 PaaI family thioesterase [Bacillota bacterium]